MLFRNRIYFAKVNLFLFINNSFVVFLLKKCNFAYIITISVAFQVLIVVNFLGNTERTSGLRIGPDVLSEK